MSPFHMELKEMSFARIGTWAGKSTGGVND